MPKPTKLKIKYDKPSKNKTFGRYNIVKNSAGIVGTIYIPAGDEAPEQIAITTQEEE